MVYSSNSFFFTLSQKYGLVGCGIFVIIHAIIGRTAGYPHTPHSPRVFQGSLDGANELLMVIPFPRLDQRLTTAWSHLPTRVTADWQQVTLCFFVHDCQYQERNCGNRDSILKINLRRINTYLVVSFLSVSTKSNLSQSERGECDFAASLLYIRVNWTPVSNDWGPFPSRSD